MQSQRIIFHPLDAALLRAAVPRAADEKGRAVAATCRQTAEPRFLATALQSTLLYFLPPLLQHPVTLFSILLCESLVALGVYWFWLIWFVVKLVD